MERFVGFFFSVSDQLPSGQLSSIPWRRAGVKYTNNEAYFDVIEEVDAIIDKSGSVVFAEIQGYVRILIAYRKIRFKINKKSEFRKPSFKKSENED